MKQVCKFVTLLVFSVLFVNTESYRILGIFPLALTSHDIFCQSVMKALAKNGHQVDVIVTRELKNPPKNYTVLYNMVEITPLVLTDVKLDQLYATYSQDAIKYLAHDFGNKICELMANEKMQEIFDKIKRGPKYDLFVIEALTVDCFIGLAHFLKIPVITLSPQNLYPWVEEAIGNPSSTAIKPTILSPLMEINSFWDRVQNLKEKVSIKSQFYHHTGQTQTNQIRKKISPDLPHVHDLPKSSVLTLINTHFSFNGVRPLTPALIEIGGLHILQDESNLTPELQKWMDESSRGVVYFSLGSIILIESLPKEILLSFYSVIQKLKPVRFLIRIKNNKNLWPSVPENLKILPWMPQIPVLRHKNTKAFITQCGLLSSLEAVYFGVPVLGIPLVADQFLNIHVLMKKNMGIRLDLKNMSKTILLESLTHILNNSSYREAAEKASNLFKDRPINAEETTIYWIEYVIRNGGILKSPFVNLHSIQRELLDVYGFLLFTICLILFLVTKILKVIINIKNRLKSDKRKEKSN